MTKVTGHWCNQSSSTFSIWKAKALYSQSGSGFFPGGFQVDTMVTLCATKSLKPWKPWNSHPRRHYHEEKLPSQLRADPKTISSSVHHAAAWKKQYEDPQGVWTDQQPTWLHMHRSWISAGGWLVAAVSAMFTNRKEYLLHQHTRALEH